ncbi:PDZ domain-containing protein [Dokdonella sp.]|uniref:PDZ domain-containing protein n=1 Tax=Dokdonella sp. TaxID=2291710 RepID=UPI001B224541|nr:PDZ domain-containing protein [Dokdonella sp.]MBO9664865.1 PDZ domain-containing protein [Dokdonella sp.]
MNRTLLLTALLLGFGHATAAEPTPTQAEASAQARAADAAAVREDREAHAESARAELAELRAQMKELSAKMARLSTELGDVGPRAYAYRYLGDPDRAVVGVVLNAEPKGARISAVTPDSPAARGGLRDGDIIVAIDGDRLAETQDAHKSLGKARELLGNLKDGQEVRIAYERAGKKQPELTLKAARREAYNWPQLIAGDFDFDGATKMGDLEKGFRTQIEMARKAAASIDYERMREDVARATASAQTAMRRIMPWWGLNLVPINPDLGRYFGSDHGALVVSVDTATRSDLRGGDVITEVAGERVDDPGDALRALRDQPAGKDIPFKVLRERKTITLNVKAPEYKSIFSALPAPAPAPAPPAAPTAPTAPAPSPGT